MQHNQRITLGVSSCLLGEKVRYDGGHKLHHYISDVLSRHFNFTPICPEVECGLTIPREAIRLKGDPLYPRLVTTKGEQDITDIMQQWCDRQVLELGKMQLRGFIFKKNSPSCGLFRVKVYRDRGAPATNGSGLFARSVHSAFPFMPLEEEGRLTDASLRENFIERIYCYDWLMTFLANNPSKGDLVRFHTRQKLLLMAHSPEHYRRLGALVAGNTPLENILSEYFTLFMQCLHLLATPAKQTNVLMHCLGYFKKNLDSWEKQELLELIERYRNGQLPLIVPVTLLKHYIRRFENAYLREQLYFSPHPDELMLRNHA